MVSALILAGALEAVGVFTIFPLITVLLGDSGQAPEILLKTTDAIFGFFSIPIELPYMLGFIVVIMTLKAAVIMVAMTQVAYATAHVIADLRVSLLRNILGANWIYYSKISAGSSANAIGSEAVRAADVYRQASNVIANMALIMFYAIIALMVSWQVSLAALVSGVTIMFILLPLIKLARRYGQQQTGLLKESSKQFVEALMSVKPIKAMARERSYVKMLEGMTTDIQTAQKRQLMSQASLLYLSEPIMVVFVALGLWGLYTYFYFPAAQILFLAVVFYRLMSRVMVAQRVYQNMVVNESALHSLLGFIRESEQERERSDGDKTASFEKKIRLDKVSFSYEDKNVLSDINLEILPGKFYAIMGGSGAGKTTLVDIITGLHKPDSGKVLLDGVSLEDVDIASWRGMIGYVPQEVILFHDTIQNNVSLGTEGVSRDDVQQALEHAGAWDFVQAMDQGMDTIVGERGSRLSGGQRQRIAIARAILRKPKLLILDEATSALDPESENGILRTVKALSGEITVIAISHKDTIKDFSDVFLLLENGAIKMCSETDRVKK